MSSTPRIKHVHDAFTFRPNPPADATVLVSAPCPGCGHQLAISGPPRSVKKKLRMLR